MNQTELIDLAKKRLGIEQDQELAKRLGIHPASVSHIRYGKGNIGPELALRVAEAAEMDPRDVVAVVMAARCKDEESRKTWEQLVSESTSHNVYKVKRKRHLLPIWYGREYQEAA